MTRITKAASTINFGSNTFRFMETFPCIKCAQDHACVHQILLHRQNLVNSQYRTWCFVKLIRMDRLVNQCCGIRQARMCRRKRRGAFRMASSTSRDQNRLVFRRSMTSLPRPLITAFIMKRLKPFTWSSLIEGGSASSWRSTTTSTRAGPGWLSA